MTSLELKDKINQLEQRCVTIVDSANKEIRSLTDDEKHDIEESRNHIEELRSQLSSLTKELNTNNISTTPKMEKQSIVKEIRAAISDGSKSFTLAAATGIEQVAEANGIVQVGTTTDVVPVATEIQGILEPLYANSVLAQLGVRFYTGLPMGDVAIPVMGNGNVGWASEIGAAAESQNTFSTITLKPKRLTAYVDVSKKLIAQDTYGVEAALQRDIVNALNAKLEATIFGDGAKTDTTPAGIFNGKTLVKATDFKAICDGEGKVEDANVHGEMKYLLSPSAKAAFRAMSKGTKSTQLVYEDGAVDGIPALVTSNVPDKQLVYGDFANLAVGSWGDVEVVVDEYTQAVNGCVRLVINAYFDAAILRDAAFYFGTVEA